MLQVETESNWNASKFFCDICDRQIADAKSAAVVFTNFNETGNRAAPLYVHKNFVHGDCLSRAEDQVKASGATPGWEELNTFLAHAIANVGMNAADVGKIMDRPDT